MKNNQQEQLNYQCNLLAYHLALNYLEERLHKAFRETGLCPVEMNLILPEQTKIHVARKCGVNQMQGEYQVRPTRD